MTELKRSWLGLINTVRRVRLLKFGYCTNIFLRASSSRLVKAASRDSAVVLLPSGSGFVLSVLV